MGWPGRPRPSASGPTGEIADRLVDAGAQAIIAGCTEIELLLRPEDLTVPLYATTQLHVLAAVDWMLDDGHRPRP